MCTYKECSKPAIHKMTDDGKIGLCDDHKKEWDAAMASGDMKKILGTWARAHGNAKNFASRF